MRVLPQQQGKVRCVAFSPDGRWFAAGGTGKIVRLWDAASWECAQEVVFDRPETLALAFQPDGTRLAIGGPCPRGVRHNPVWLWNVGKRQVDQLLRREDSDTVAGLAFTPDGTRLYVCRRLVGGRGGELGFCRLGLKSTRYTLTRAVGATAIATSPDGKYVVEGASSTGVWVERLRTTGSPILRIRQRVNAVAIRPDSQRAAAGHGQTVTLFTPLRPDDATVELSGHADEVLGVAYSPDGATLASGGKDGLLIFWDAAAGSERQRLDLKLGPVNGLAFAPDSLILAAAADHGLVLLDIG